MNEAHSRPPALSWSDNSNSSDEGEWGGRNGGGSSGGEGVHNETGTRGRGGRKEGMSRSRMSSCDLSGFIQGEDTGACGKMERSSSLPNPLKESPGTGDYGFFVDIPDDELTGRGVKTSEVLDLTELTQCRTRVLPKYLTGLWGWGGEERSRGRRVGGQGKGREERFRAVPAEVIRYAAAGGGETGRREIIKAKGRYSCGGKGGGEGERGTGRGGGDEVEFRVRIMAGKSGDGGGGEGGEMDKGEPPEVIGKIGARVNGGRRRGRFTVLNVGEEKKEG
ncbi:hypothetical protein TrCOL_g12978 [Triparma columacea]|uniref:Uncharacterized protein n=1 Tax=Triparma columacea TaxID=722753 RepID=A0A9W7LC45_9STRA|nr:hypothetical protein TrCOL_g12978 [Triparma columacea]